MMNVNYCPTIDNNGMQQKHWPLVLALTLGSVIGSTPAAQAVRITYDVEYFLDQSFSENIVAPRGTKVGSATFSYETNNLINFDALFPGESIGIIDRADSDFFLPAQPGPSSTRFGNPYFVIDQFSGTLLGAQWSLFDRLPAYFLIGTQNLPDGNVATFDSSYNAVSPIGPDGNVREPEFTFNSNSWPFLPLRNPNNPTQILSDPRRIDMVSLGGCAASLSNCRDPFSVIGNWYSVLVTPNADIGGGGSANGFFKTSLRTTLPEVPEPSTQMLEVFGGLLLFFGILNSRWRKKAST